MFAAVCAITGYAIWLGTTAKQPNVRYGAIYLIAMAGYTAGPTPYGWALSNASPATIRAVTAAMIVNSRPAFPLSLFPGTLCTNTMLQIADVSVP